MLEKNAKIFIAGHRGLVGSAIWNNLQQRGYTNLVGRSHKELDLLDGTAVKKFFDEERPEAVVLYGSGKEMIFVENQLKTESSVRTFPLIPHIEQMLIERKTLEEYYSKLLGKDFDREYDGFVCRDNFGKLITPNFVTSHFKYIIQKNKLKHIRFHDLRHSCASLLLANGVSMKAIQEWLGHSTFNVTANFYSHLDFHSKVESAETIAKVLGGDSADTEQAIHDKGSEGKKSRKSST